MNDRSLAISILQTARDVLSQRLTERIIESRDEIESDAAGESYLSEIEALYEQMGGRLAHLNAMLTNLPPLGTVPAADATASEIVYADLASASSNALDLEATAPLTLLALPAPASLEAPLDEAPSLELFANVVLAIRADNLAAASGLLADLLDIRPSQSRRAVRVFAEHVRANADIARRFAEFGTTIMVTNEYAGAALLTECFDFHPTDALAMVRSLHARLNTMNDASPY